MMFAAIIILTLAKGGLVMERNIGIYSNEYMCDHRIQMEQYRLVGHSSQKGMVKFECRRSPYRYA